MRGRRPASCLSDSWRSGRDVRRGTSPSTQAAVSTPSTTASAKAPAKKKARRLSTGLHTPKHHHHHRKRRAVAHRPAGVPVVDEPNPALTPGAAFAVGRARICVAATPRRSETCRSRRRTRCTPATGFRTCRISMRSTTSSRSRSAVRTRSRTCGRSRTPAGGADEGRAGGQAARPRLLGHDRAAARAADRGAQLGRGLQALRRLAARRDVVRLGWVGQLRRRGAEQWWRWQLHPGYSPCLAYRGGADYRYGGDGNGPYFTAPGVVTLHRHGQRSVPPRRQRRRRGVRLGRYADAASSAWTSRRVTARTATKITIGSSARCC